MSAKSIPEWITTEALAQAMDPEAFTYVPDGSPVDVKMKLRQKAGLRMAESIMELLQKLTK